MKCFITLISIVFLFCTSASRAEQNESDKLLLTYITQNPAYVTMLNNHARRLFKISLPNCETEPEVKRLYPSVTEKVYFLSDPQRTEKNHPFHGQWIERVQLSACGQAIRHNFLVSSYNQASVPYLSPLLNGNTRIQPIDQNRAEMVAKEKIREFGCTKPSFVLGANFIGYKVRGKLAISKNDENAGWFEEWAIDACDKITAVNMAVLPDTESRLRFVAKVKTENDSSPTN